MTPKEEERRKALLPSVEAFRGLNRKQAYLFADRVRPCCDEEDQAYCFETTCPGPCPAGQLRNSIGILFGWGAEKNPW